MSLDQNLRLALEVERNWAEAWASLGLPDARPRTQVDAVASAPPAPSCSYLRVYTPGEPEMLLNNVLRYSQPQPVTRDDVERVIAPFRQHRLPFQWWLTLGADPPELRDRLRELGMRAWGSAAAMAAPLDGWAPPTPAPLPGVRLGRVAAEAEAQGALRVICEVFFVPWSPMSRWTIANPAFGVYLATWQERPAAALAVYRSGEVVGVYHVATLPLARRRGLASALLAQALGEAQRAGARLATLTATPEAQRLYERLGFRVCGAIEQWMPGPALMGALSTGRL